jgi:hypothetical protein
MREGAPQRHEHHSPPPAISTMRGRSQATKGLRCAVVKGLRCAVGPQLALRSRQPRGCGAG